jgi:hypothetical protein
MKKSFKISALVAVAVLIVGGVWLNFGDDGDNKPLPIARQFNADGTIDYTLVNRDRFNGDVHWILRLPKQLKVKLPEDDNNAMREAYLKRTNDQSESKKRGYIPNFDLSFALTMPDYGLNAKTRLANVEDVIVLDVYGHEYLRKNLDNDVDEVCKLGGEIFPRIFEVIDLTPSDDGKNQKLLRESLLCTNATWARYAVFDEQGGIYGTFGCYKSDQAVCSGSFWLPQERSVSYEFRKIHLSQIHDIHAYIVQFLTKATVSINTIEKNGRKAKPHVN